MITITDKKECCGCTACISVCPVQCIDMIRDHEGFVYPKADADRCIGCNACDKVCPILNPVKEEPARQYAYIVQNKDEQIRKESTSGGMFTALANYVIDRGGIVYGAAYGQNFNVIHTSVESRNGLNIFRNSKYVQSNMGGVLPEIKRYLQDGREVLFSGTPCQVEGLKAYLKREYENLITMDIVCHAVPSPLIWQKYLEMQKAKLDKEFENVLFREKHFGYQYSTMTIRNKSGRDVYVNGIDTDPMLRAFFSNICDRPSCYDCRFKKRYRVSDMTVWDCYPVYKFDPKLDDDKGTSRVLIQSEKGMNVFREVQNQLRIHEVEPDQLVDGVKEMFHSVPMNENRDQFFTDANQMSGEELFRKYFPITFRTRTEKAVRRILYKTGIYSTAKRTAKKILRKE